MPALRTVLITGFEPFDGHSINASWEVASRLDGALIEDGRCAVARLPCRFGDCITELERCLQQHSPDLVIGIGQAEGRTRISIERTAVNLRDARIADNGGYQPIDLPVIPQGPWAYPSRLPVRDLMTGLQARGYPIEISNSAGTFVCNDLFYGLMHLTRETPSMIAGFVHLPILPEQRRSPVQRSADRDDAPRGFNQETPAIALELQIAVISSLIQIALLRSSTRNQNSQ